MDNYILTCFHHGGGGVVSKCKPTYQQEVDVYGVAIDKDHFSLVKFLSYTKDLGYTNVKAFYCENGDEFHVYVVHEVDELEESPAQSSF